MTLNGKRDSFSREDIYTMEKLSPAFTREKMNAVIENTLDCVSEWKSLAKENEVPKPLAEKIESNFRMYL